METSAKAVVIIPAYNEGERVETVVRVARACPLVSQVIVSTDGSTDNTAEVARIARARVAYYKDGINRGKGCAMYAGVKLTDEEFICFLDADLTNATVQHLESLIGPVVRGEVPATMAVFRNGRVLTDLAQRFFPMISGQRCLRRDLLQSLTFKDWNCRYGIEIELNEHLRAQGIHSQVIYWDGASHVMKEEKAGLLKGFRQRIRMYIDVGRVRIKHRVRGRPRPQRTN